MKNDGKSHGKSTKSHQHSTFTSTFTSSSEQVAHRAGELKDGAQARRLRVREAVHLEIHRGVVEGVPRDGAKEALPHQAEERGLREVAP